MKDIFYKEYTIKLKQYQGEEWLVAVRNTKNQTLVSQWHETETKALEWATKLIDAGNFQGVGCCQ